MESDPRWILSAPATGPMFGQRAGCVQRPSRGISHWAYSESQLKCLPLPGRDQGDQAAPGEKLPRDGGAIYRGAR